MSPPSDPQTTAVTNKRLNTIAGQVGGGILLLIVGMISESNLQIISSKGTPDDVLARLDVIEDKLVPETFRPNPWTSLQEDQQQELTRQEFKRVAESLGDINRALADLRKLFLGHQIKHQDENRSKPHVPRPESLPNTHK